MPAPFEALASAIIKSRAKPSALAGAAQAASVFAGGEIGKRIGTRIAKRATNKELAVLQKELSAGREWAAKNFGKDAPEFVMFRRYTEAAKSNNIPGALNTVKDQMQYNALRRLEQGHAEQLAAHMSKYETPGKGIGMVAGLAASKAVPEVVHRFKVKRLAKKLRTGAVAGGGAAAGGLILYNKNKGKTKKAYLRKEAGPFDAVARLFGRGAEAAAARGAEVAAGRAAETTAGQAFKIRPTAATDEFSRYLSQSKMPPPASPGANLPGLNLGTPAPSPFQYASPRDAFLAANAAQRREIAAFRRFSATLPEGQQFSTGASPFFDIMGPRTAFNPAGVVPKPPATATSIVDRLRGFFSRTKAAPVATETAAATEVAAGSTAKKPTVLERLFGGKKPAPATVEPPLPANVLPEMPASLTAATPARAATPATQVINRGGTVDIAARAAQETNAPRQLSLFGEEGARTTAAATPATSTAAAAAPEATNIVAKATPEAIADAAAKTGLPASSFEGMAAGELEKAVAASQKELLNLKPTGLLPAAVRSFRQNLGRVLSSNANIPAAEKIIAPFGKGNLAQRAAEARGIQETGLEAAQKSRGVAARIARGLAGAGEATAVPAVTSASVLERGVAARAAEQEAARKALETAGKGEVATAGTAAETAAKGEGAAAETAAKGEGALATTAEGGTAQVEGFIKNIANSLEKTNPQAYKFMTDYGPAIAAVAGPLVGMYGAKQATNIAMRQVMMKAAPYAAGGLAAGAGFGLLSRGGGRE